MKNLEDLRKTIARSIEHSQYPMLPLGLGGVDGGKSAGLILDVLADPTYREAIVEAMNRDRVWPSDEERARQIKEIMERPGPDEDT